jgi:hypothetical protein
MEKSPSRGRHNCSVRFGSIGAEIRRLRIALNQPNHSPQCQLNIRTRSVRTARHCGRTQ